MKTQRLKIFLFIYFFIAAYTVTIAQNYTVTTETSQTYTELTGDIDVGISPTSFIGNIPPINTTIKFFAADINLQTEPFSVNMALGAISSVSSNNTVTQIYCANGFPNSGIAVANSKVSYTLSSDWLKVQFKDVSFKNLPVTEVANYQIWVNLKDNSIELHYGVNTISSATPIVGLAERKLDFSTVNIHQLTGDPAAPTKTSNGGGALTNLPDDGTVYKYKYNAASTGVTSINNDATVKVYPNPASDAINFDLSSFQSKVKNIEIYNQIGQKIKTVNPDINTSQIQVKTTDFPAGIYYATIKTEQGFTVSEKIILQ